MIEIRAKGGPCNNINIINSLIFWTKQIWKNEVLYYLCNYCLK
jgi:hypothetical protein